MPTGHREPLRSGKPWQRNDAAERRTLVSTAMTDEPTPQSIPILTPGVTYPCLTEMPAFAVGIVPRLLEASPFVAVQYRVGAIR